MDFKVCHHGDWGMPSWTSRYVIMDFEVCHHGHQVMPMWTSRYVIIVFEVCHHCLQGMPSLSARYAIIVCEVCHDGLHGVPSWTMTCHQTFWSCLFSSCVHTFWLQKSTEKWISFLEFKYLIMTFTHNRNDHRTYQKTLQNTIWFLKIITKMPFWSLPISELCYLNNKRLFDSLQRWS